MMRRQPCLRVMKPLMDMYTEDLYKILLRSG